MTNNFDHLFLNHTEISINNYQNAIEESLKILIKNFALPNQAYSGLTPEKLESIPVELCPEEGKQLSEILENVGETIIKHSANVSHPTCIAHLHCPTLIPALAAELLISATNQSMDSWDQSPGATFLEQKVINNLCKLYGFTEESDGTFTSGGTQSNFMGMLLARDYYAQKYENWSIQKQGLSPLSSRFRILCSEVSHFTISQSASLLGLGQKAIIPVKSDQKYRLSIEDLKRKIDQLKAENLIPIAIVGTVGTTDFGSIDPIAELVEIAQENKIWLHLDAAYGGALILSDQYKDYLRGINQADSLTIDFHKLFYQPISCGAFLLKNKANFNLIKLHADYLNPDENEELGVLDLVTKSVQTTRRFDALKLYISLQNLGQKTFANLIETTIELAKNTADLISQDQELELATEPTINSVVFRYINPNKNSQELDKINQQIRLKLIENGKAIIAQTKVNQLVFLKFTLLNPRTTIEDLKNLLTEIKNLGKILAIKS